MQLVFSQPVPPPVMTEPVGVILRETVRETDKTDIRRILEASGYFHPFEIEAAVDLVDERLWKGERSGYYFLFAEQGGVVTGFTCFGPIACTQARFDLFWIAVAPLWMGKGLGRYLLSKTEERVRLMGGDRVYVETSGRELYLRTRQFYERCGYQVEACLKDFYTSGDDKVIFLKRLV